MGIELGLLMEGLIYWSAFAAKRRIRRPTSLKSTTVKQSVEDNQIPVKKVAQDRSDQAPASATNRFRVRSKTRGGLAAGAAAGGAAAIIAGASTNALVTKKVQDKDGYKVG